MKAVKQRERSVCHLQQQYGQKQPLSFIDLSMEMGLSPNDEPSTPRVIDILV